MRPWSVCMCHTKGCVREVAPRVNKTVDDRFPRFNKNRPVNRSNRLVNHACEFLGTVLRWEGGNRTGSCTGPDRLHREPVEPDRLPPVLRILVAPAIAEPTRLPLRVSRQHMLLP
jgi:hypothetical protein